MIRKLCYIFTTLQEDPAATVLVNLEILADLLEAFGCTIWAKIRCVRYTLTTRPTVAG